MQTVALDGTGVDRLWTEIEAHRIRSLADGSREARRALRNSLELAALLQNRFEARLGEHSQSEHFREIAQQLANGKLSLATALDRAEQR